jgi:hypothetical protein
MIEVEQNEFYILVLILLNLPRIANLSVTIVNLSVRIGYMSVKIAYLSVRIV